MFAIPYNPVELLSMQFISTIKYRKGVPSTSVISCWCLTVYECILSGTELHESVVLYNTKHKFSELFLYWWSQRAISVFV